MHTQAERAKLACLLSQAETDATHNIKCGTEFIQADLMPRAEKLLRALKVINAYPGLVYYIFTMLK